MNTSQEKGRNMQRRIRSMRCGRRWRAAALLGAVIAWNGAAGITSIHATVVTTGDVVPDPPDAGGAFAGPFRIGNVDVGTLSITAPSGAATPITHTGAAVLGDTVTGVGIATLNGFGSDWTLT